MAAKLFILQGAAKPLSSVPVWAEPSQLLLGNWLFDPHPPQATIREDRFSGVENKAANRRRLTEFTALGSSQGISQVCQIVRSYVNEARAGAINIRYEDE